MNNILAGQATELGMAVSPDWDLDTVEHPESDLTDAELLAVAMEDALDAVTLHGLIGITGLDELAARRIRRAATVVLAETTGDFDDLGGVA